MRVKKYTAKNMKEALRLIKEELGPDAVILAARDIKKGPSQGEVEVTAAVSEVTLHKKNFTESRMDADTKERFRNTAARSQKTIIEKIVDRRLAENNALRGESSLSRVLGGDGRSEPSQQMNSPVNKLKRNVTSVSYIDIPDDAEMEHAQAHSRATAAPAKQNFAPRKQHPEAYEMAEEVSKLSPRSLGRIRNAAKEAFTAGMSALESKPVKNNYADITNDPREDFRFEKISSKAQTMPEPAKKMAASSAIRGEQIEVLQSEIVRLQSLLKQSHAVPMPVNSHPGAEYGIHFELSFMFQKLLESGVNIELATEILLQAQKEMDALQLKKRPLVDAYVARWILTNTKITTDAFHGRTHFFVGPAGSGKTSMLVKWASYLSLKKKKRIAILTTDTQKVGAVDQLKIYAQILNVPFVVIRSQEDFSGILTQFANIDHFLVDSPGMQLKDLNEIDFLRATMPPPEMAAITHLVLNCIAKDSDSFDSCKRFRLANYQDLIFTNLDQSIQHGVIVNVSRALNVPLNSFGIGNSIPEDFEEATKERILDLIFKLTRIQRGVNGHGI